MSDVMWSPQEFTLTRWHSRVLGSYSRGPPTWGAPSMSPIISVTGSAPETPILLPQTQLGLSLGRRGLPARVGT